MPLVESPPEEADLGIAFYATTVPGVGGRIKQEPEDFVVVEKTKWPRQDPDGPYLALEVRARNWEMNRLASRIARAAHLSRTRVGFAGTKDKRAVTTQGLTLRLDGGPPADVRLPDVEVLRSFRVVGALGLGDLASNAFDIAVTQLDVDPQEGARRATAAFGQAEQAGGFANFFGTQRFGALRPVTHRVGAALVEGDFERAVAIYLGTPSAFESPDVQQFRQAYREGRSPRELLQSVPPTLSFERELLESMAASPDRPLDALLALPRNLTLMFIHAHQSQLFNRILSERLRRGLPLGGPLEGDLVVPLEEEGGALEDEPVPVTAANLAKVERQVRLGRAAVTGLVPGIDAPMAKGVMGEVEAAVLEAAGRKPQDFVIADAARLTTKGVRRPLAMRPAHVLVEPAQVRGEGALRLRFALPRGCYATIVLREVLKRPESAWARQAVAEPS